MRDVQIGRPAVWLHPDGRHQIEPQQRKVHQIVAGQRLVAQMCVNQTQATKATAARAQPSDLGQCQARRITDEHVLDLPTSADENPHLSINLVRNAAQVDAQLTRDQLLGTQTTTIDPLKRVKLTAGDAGKSVVSVVGKGANLAAQQPPYSGKVTVQLKASNGKCWDATYSSPTANRGGLFRAKSD